MTQENKIRAREAALISLCRCERDGKYANLELDAAIKKYALDSREKALFTNLLYGTIERMLTLDYILDKLSDKPLKQCSCSVRNILRLSLYQLIYLDRIPAHAAVNEAVELTKKYENKRAAAFTNAILQSYLRRGENIIFPSEKDQGSKALSVRYSVSEPICALLLQQYPDCCEELLSAFCSRPNPTLRVNTCRTSREAMLKQLQDNKILCKETPLSPYGIRLLQDLPTTELFRLIESNAYIEDEASQLAVCALKVEPGMRVIDVCAAPGGKSVGAAIEMKNEGGILSLDLHQNKLSLIDTAAQKMGISIIATRAHDSKCSISELAGQFDRCICDVPCSGLGVIAKKPDLRYKDIHRLEQLLETQRRILDASACYIRPGGILVYSTCTLNKNENEEQVIRFLNEHREFSICRESGNAGKTLLPHRDQTDGFFIAALLKQEIR